jgi:nicotinamidase/pyrazinamidase
MKALIIVDIQNDFLPDGALHVPEGNQVVPVINRIQEKFPLVIASQDWHPSDHKSFASNHQDKKPYDVIMLDGLEQVLWPDHCVQGTKGAEFSEELSIKKIEAVIRKGMNPMIDSYSTFFDNGHKKSTGLCGYLRERNVDHVYMAGLAQDYCVYFSSRDALNNGFKVSIIEDAVKPINKTEAVLKMKELKNMGAEIIRSNEPGEFN